MQRIIGAGLGAIATYVLLVLFAGTQQSQVYLVAVAIGLIVSIVWPWIISFMVARRVRDRRKDEIDREVQEQLAQKSRGE
jgi:branched-subunit amino acid ABC-type transport system permease component